jgi:hypothetical protein
MLNQDRPDVFLKKLELFRRDRLVYHLPAGGRGTDRQGEYRHAE